MWLYPKILAHRGGGTLAPENTLAALRCGLEHGFKAVEFDVMLSGDGVPVLMHDPSFGRTVAGVGEVAETPADALMRMDAGAWFGKQFVGELVPSFEQAVRFCREHGIWINIEIKPATGFEKQTGRVVGEYARRLFDEPAHDRLPLFSSFSLDALLEARKAAPHIPRGFLIDVLPADWPQTMRMLDAVALHTNHKNLTPELARKVKAAGYGLFCYTVNEPSRARELLRWGVDAFCTDRIDLIRPDFV